MRTGHIPGQSLSAVRVINWLFWLFLVTPSNLDKTGSLEGIFVQFLDDTLPLIVEDEVVGNESFYNCLTRRMSVMIGFILSGLGIFAQVRPNVATKSHNIKKEVTD
jgi:hypothetical protein